MRSGSWVIGPWLWALGTSHCGVLGTKLPENEMTRHRPLLVPCHFICSPGTVTNSEKGLPSCRFCYLSKMYYLEIALRDGARKKLVLPAHLEVWTETCIHNSSTVPKLRMPQPDAFGLPSPLMGASCAFKSVPSHGQSKPLCLINRPTFWGSFLGAGTLEIMGMAFSPVKAASPSHGMAWLPQLP